MHTGRCRFGGGLRRGFAAFRLYTSADFLVSDYTTAGGYTPSSVLSTNRTTSCTMKRLVTPHSRWTPSSSPTTPWIGRSPAFTSQSASMAGAYAAPCKPSFWGKRQCFLPTPHSHPRQGHSMKMMIPQTPATRTSWSAQGLSIFQPSARLGSTWGRRWRSATFRTKGNHLTLSPPERACGDKKQRTSMLETAQSSSLVRELDILADSQRERRSYSTRVGPSTPTRIQSGRCRQQPHTCCSRNLQLSPSSGSSSRCPRWPPRSSRLWTPTATASTAC